VVEYLPSTFQLSAPTDVVLKISTIYAMKDDYMAKNWFYPPSFEKFKKSIHWPPLEKQYRQIQNLEPVVSKEYTYTSEAIKENKDSFILELSAELYRKNIVKGKENLILLPLYHATASIESTIEGGEIIKKGEYWGPIGKYLDDFWQKITAKENNPLMPQKDYANAVWITHPLFHQPQDLPQEKILKSLNDVIKKHRQRSNPLESFAYSFFDSYIKNLPWKQQLIQCPSCGLLVAYKYNKVHCSNKCAKHMAYLRQNKKRPNLNREKVKEYRDFLKSKGIKKSYPSKKHKNN